jgi:IS5 family transposase
MSDDLVKRLRAAAYLAITQDVALKKGLGVIAIAHDALLDEAADRIEELETKLTSVSMERTGRVKPLEWEQSRDSDGVLQDVYWARCPLFEKRFWAEGKDKIAGVEARRAARIMKVIEVINV